MIVTFARNLPERAVGIEHEIDLGGRPEAARAEEPAKMTSSMARPRRFAWRCARRAPTERRPRCSDCPTVGTHTAVMPGSSVSALRSATTKPLRTRISDTWAPSHSLLGGGALGPRGRPSRRPAASRSGDPRRLRGGLLLGPGRLLAAFGGLLGHADAEELGEARERGFRRLALGLFFVRPTPAAPCRRRTPGRRRWRWRPLGPHQPIGGRGCRPPRSSFWRGAGILRLAGQPEGHLWA